MGDEAPLMLPTTLQELTISQTYSNFSLEYLEVSIAEQQLNWWSVP